MTSVAERRIVTSPQTRIAEIIKIGEGVNAWMIKKIKPLSRKEFSDNIEVDQFLLMFTPRSLRSRIEDKLNRENLKEEWQKHEVFRALSILSEASVCSISLVESGKHQH